MPTSTVRLRQQDVLNVAKNLIRPPGWQCEWNIASLNKPTMCRTLLTSWQAYLKHLLVHCQEYRQEYETHIYACRLPRCSLASGLSITSYEDLIKHLQLSHLNRAALQCPVKGCDPITFTRHGSLENHFLDAHPEMVGQTINLPSALLLPSWLPFYPGPTELPPLPPRVSLGSVLVPTVQGTWQHRPSTPKRSDTGKPTYSSPKKTAKMEISGELKSKEDTQEESREFMFDDLSNPSNKVKHYSNLAEQECVVRETGPYFDVSRPQPQLDPNAYGHRLLPATILYDAWRRQNEASFVFSSDEDENEHENGRGDKVQGAEIIPD